MTAAPEELLVLVDDEGTAIGTTDGADAWSPWCREQARLLEAAGLVPGR